MNSLVGHKQVNIFLPYMLLLFLISVGGITHLFWLQQKCIGIE